MSETIRTERLVMRRFSMDDVEAMHRIMIDPVAMAYWSTLPHESIDQTRDWVQSEVDAQGAGSDDFVLTLDGCLIGKLGCWKLPEIGYLIDPAHWGQGYAGEALAAFIDRRRRLGSLALTADVDPRNTASLRLLGRAGFVETGRAARTWKIGENWFDSIYLERDLTRD